MSLLEAPGMNTLRPLIAALLVLPLFHAPAAQPVTRATVTAHGIKLTLEVPVRVFPQDALERFTLHVKNVSTHTVLTRFGNLPCSTNPRVEVIDATGAPTPQMPPNGAGGGCAPVRGLPLKPGGGFSVTPTHNWTAVTAGRLYSGCQGPQEWSAYVGYVGYPIWTISYTRTK